MFIGYKRRAHRLLKQFGIVSKETLVFKAIAVDADGIA
jgi:hypothetical protein